LSSIYKSGAVVIGDPLEIKNESVQQDNTALDEETKQQIEMDDRIRCRENKIIKDAEEKASQIMDDAKQKSLEVREAAREEGYKTGLEEGYEKGIQEGQAKGRQQGLDTAREMIEEALEIKQRALETKERIVKEAEEEIIRIVMEIARKIVGEQFKTDREAILGPVKKALEKCAFSARVIMKVSPEDYDVVELSKSRLMAEIEGISQIEIIAEDTLSQGSCLLETDAGFINSSLEVQLDRIEEAFRELLSHE